ncbi:MAG: PP2C family protein-serine/threonine phosphatase, partial [candidate division Zixibacteria bacterium]|nr:PP2C family protein-serine/threonine phosphatase [candidate division Zixibacteria bacterium]
VLANQTVVAINNARLYKESMENQRREEELAIARQIQRQLLPKQMPSSDKLQFSAYSESSREVGGDYYDFINISDTRLAFAIGDASGKGVPASLLIARMQAILHSVAVSELDINSKIHHINNVLSVSGMPERFITFFYGEIDIDKMTLQYCNAGHNYPLLLHQNGDYDMLQEGGLLLGAFADAPYQSGSKKLDSGDLLMCYTDGVTEAMDYNDVEFGEEKLTNLLISKNDVPLKSLEETILDNIRMHCGDRPLQDDATMLMMKVL